MFSILFFANNLDLVYQRLATRGWITQVTDPKTGQTYWSETIQHLDIAEIPNPVAQTPAVLDGQGNITTPAVMYPQRVLVVRVSRDRLADETDGIAQTEADGVTLREIINRTKIGQWIRDNSTAVTLTGYVGAPTYQTQISLPARKINSVNIWLVREGDAEQWIHNWL